ncbi:unnamed protein product, partial [Prorocentrum cordatum]
PAAVLSRAAGLASACVSALRVFALIGSGLLVQRCQVLPAQLAAKFRNVCFKVLMPAFLMRAVWIVQMDSSLYTIAAVSTVVHAAWFLVALAMARSLAPDQRHRQGWLMLMSQGGMLSFLYPLLLSTPHLAERSLACAVLWDMGGNVWICQGGLYGIAEHFCGDAHTAEASSDVEMAQVSPAIRGQEADLKDRAGGKGADGAVQGVPRSSAAGAGGGWKATKAVLRQPLLHICMSALLMNAMGVRIPAVLDATLWAAGAPFKPGMYFLVGYYGNLALNKADLIVIAQALGSRYATATVIALMVWTMPIERIFRETITLALYSPMTSNVMQIVADIGTEQQLRLTNVLVGVFAMLHAADAGVL